jgi:hypothetical protein
LFLTYSKKSERFLAAAADEGERHRRGWMVGEVEGYLWMRRRAAAVGGCDKRAEAAAAGGGAMRKRKWCVVCPLTYFIRRS